jgi:hypothetical protein
MASNKWYRRERLILITALLVTLVTIIFLQLRIEQLEAIIASFNQPKLWLL